MNITLTNFSIVVLAQAHNPSILNPDFLKINKIVEHTYTPKNVVCTMPVAQIVYQEGISVVAEFERLQFIDTLPERTPDASPIPAIAIRYVNTLPHVRYTAVGINYTGHFLFKDRSSSRIFVSNRFIKKDPWLESEDLDIGLKLTRAFDNTRRTISLETTELIKSENERLPIILMNANYHFEGKENKFESIKSFISDWRITFDDFTKFIGTIFSGV